MAKVKSKSGGVRIYPCTCEHEYQDRKYGRGKRVHNLGIGEPPSRKCTVCGIKSK